MNIIKVLWCRFEKSSRTFTTLLLKGFCQTGFFRHLSGYDFEVRNLKITKSVRVSFLSKFWKFHLHFKIEARNAEKGFCFWHNCIWIGIVKLSLLRRGYFSSAANVLTSSPKICHVNKRNFLEHISLQVTNKYDKSAVRLPCCFLRCPLKRDFLSIYLTTFPESVISEKQKQWRSPFSSKWLELNLDFKNAEKNFLFEIIASEFASLDCLY